MKIEHTVCCKGKGNVKLPVPCDLLHFSPLLPSTNLILLGQIDFYFFTITSNSKCCKILKPIILYIYLLAHRQTENSNFFRIKKKNK